MSASTQMAIKTGSAFLEGKKKLNLKASVKIESFLSFGFSFLSDHTKSMWNIYQFTTK